MTEEKPVNILGFKRKVREAAVEENVESPVQFNIKSNYCNFKKKKIIGEQKVLLIQFGENAKIRLKTIQNRYKLMSTLKIVNNKIIKPTRKEKQFIHRYSYQKIPEVLDYDIESEESSIEEADSEGISIGDITSLIDDDDEYSSDLVDELDNEDTEYPSFMQPNYERPFFSTKNIKIEKLLDEELFINCEFEKSKQVTNEIKKSIKTFLETNDVDSNTIYDFFNISKTVPFKEFK